MQREPETLMAPTHGAARPCGGRKIDARKTQEFREAARSRALQQWSSPEARARQSELIKQKMKSDAVRERISERTRVALAGVEVKRRHVLGVCEAMQRPDVIARISQNTRAGMARWRQQRMNELRRLWKIADRKMRTEFLVEIGAVTDQGSNRA